MKSPLYFFALSSDLDEGVAARILLLKSQLYLTEVEERLVVKCLKCLAKKEGRKLTVQDIEKFYSQWRLY